AERESGQGLGQMAEGRTREAEETAIHIERIRETLAAGPGQPSPGPGNRATA
ncbi:MAG: hypothetical protein H7Z75_00930, partial [Ferruginibacter sp.]|nr:hypothetical protein [Cytophagales bacterium]